MIRLEEGIRQMEEILSKLPEKSSVKPEDPEVLKGKARMHQQMLEETHANASRLHDIAVSGQHKTQIVNSKRGTSLTVVK